MRHAAFGGAVLAVLALAAALGPAQTTRPATQPGGTRPPGPRSPMVNPDALRFYLMDGSMITGKLVARELIVETRYGSLKVPVADIRSITPGLQSHPEHAQRIQDQIDKLGSVSFDEREAAKKALIDMGPGIRAQLLKYRDDPDPERRERTRAILEEFDVMEEEEEGAGPKVVLARGDSIETPDFTAVGTLTLRSLDIVSPYGPLTIKIGDLKRAQRDIEAKDDTTKTIQVEGTQVVYRGFKTTPIKVERGDQVSITADGTITLTPWGNNASSTPDGATNYGWYIPGQIPTGCLIGKIGTGNVFKIGSKSTFTADRGGVLQLAVAMQGNYGDQPFPGQYTVRVRVNKKK